MFKTSLSHCICHRFAGKAFAARPIAPTGQASCFCLLSESNRMRSLHNRENKKGLTSEADSLTGKLEGQSYNCSSALTPEVELIFLNIGMSYNFRQLTISVTPSWAWQIDTRLARPLPFWRGSWRQGRNPSMSEMVAAVATCGYCSSAVESGGLHRATHWGALWLLPCSATTAAVGQVYFWHVRSAWTWCWTWRTYYTNSKHRYVRNLSAV